MYKYVCVLTEGGLGGICFQRNTLFFEYYFIIQQNKNLLVPDMKPKTYLKITIIPDLYPFSSEKILKIFTRRRK